MVANAYRLRCHFGGGATGASKTPLASFRSIRSPRLQNNITAYISIGYLDGHQRPVQLRVEKQIFILASLDKLVKTGYITSFHSIDSMHMLPVHAVQ